MKILCLSDITQRYCNPRLPTFLIAVLLRWLLCHCLSLLSVCLYAAEVSVAICVIVIDNRRAAISACCTAVWTVKFMNME